jgi:hypothetical protein
MMSRATCERWRRLVRVPVHPDIDVVDDDWRYQDGEGGKGEYEV